jgi:carboxylate-amine ligase
MHVDVSGEEESVRVMDGIRPWLPVLLAMSGNSPYWEGRDTCFASWRSQVSGRWPSSGPAEPFGSADVFRSTVGKMIEWGAAMDDGMLYLDARPSSSYPTVEIRVADVCTEVEDAVLIATLARALVETAASGPAPAEHWRSDLLRAATWRAARYGLSSTLVDPRTMELAPAREVFESLRAHTREALRESDDWDRTCESFERLLAQGTGAARQRAAHEVSGSVAGVVQDLVRRTEASWNPTA